MKPLEVILPWPPAALSPNARHGHWGSLSRPKRKYRTTCAWLARQAGFARLGADRLRVGLVIVPPDLRHRDLDNVIAALKSGLDGLVDALGVDDSRWALDPAPRWGDGVGGFVKVTVEVVA